MRNYNCSRYGACLEKAALADAKKMGCLSCERSDGDARLDIGDPLLNEYVLRCCSLLAALFIEEAPGDRAVIPPILGWSISYEEKMGKLRGCKRIDGKLKWLYLGKSLSNAGRKIQKFEDSRAAQ